MTPYPGETVLLAGDPEFTALVAEELRRTKANCHVVVPGRSPLAPATLDRVDPDLILLAGYMDVVPDDVVQAFPVWSFHPSLLPRFRGGSAVKWQRHLVEEPCGITIYQLAVGKLDAGPIVVQRKLNEWGELVPASYYATDGEFYRALVCLGVGAFATAVRQWLDESYTLTPQDEEAATWHPRLAKGQSPSEYLAHAAQAQGPTHPA